MDILVLPWVVDHIFSTFSISVHLIFLYHLIFLHHVLMVLHRCFLHLMVHWRIHLIIHRHILILQLGAIPCIDSMAG
jgi:hypothetical protein